MYHVIACMLMVLHLLCLEEYKVETIKGAKVAWQVDPRFQDSSSEDEEEQEEEGKEKEEAASVTVVE